MDNRKFHLRKRSGNDLAVILYKRTEEERKKAAYPDVKEEVIGYALDDAEAEEMIKRWNAYNGLVEAVQCWRSDMQMLIDGEWDGSADGAEAALRMADRALEEAAQ